MQSAPFGNCKVRIFQCPIIFCCSPSCHISIVANSFINNCGASFDADTENPELQRDKSDSEPKSDQGDEPPTREPKYKVGMFIRKEVDNIECTGFIYQYVLDKESFVYYVHLNKPDTDESITKEDISTFIFFSLECWVVEKNLDVYVRVGKTDHPATIDSMIRLIEELVDTNSVRIR